LCLAETMKTGSRQAVLGIRISEFQVLSGTAIDYIQKVNIFLITLLFLISLFKIIPSIGGLPKQSTRKFLADGQEVSEEEPAIAEDNVAQYNAVLWPLKSMDSSDIIQLCNCKFSANWFNNNNTIQTNFSTWRTSI
jgi:hypothetical protein